VKGKNKTQKVIFEKIKKTGLDAFFTTNYQNIKYLTGFDSLDGALLITKEKIYFFTSSCEIGEARSRIISGRVLERKRSDWTFLKDIVQKEKVRRLGFEENHLSLLNFKALKKSVPRCKLKGIVGFIEDLRALKSEQEILKIKKVISITENIFSRIRRYLKPGCSESHVFRKICEFIAQEGCKPAFNPIVAFGAHTAHPHAAPKGKRLKKGDLILVDMGVNLEGYNSDLTRTFIKGRLDSKQKKIYHLVLKAHDYMYHWIKPGVSIKVVEKEAHSCFEKSGLAKYFFHSIGHGIGLEVHEQPFFSEKNKGKLMPGMIFTLEPALYLPGWGGVRIEDMFLMTGKGCQKLSNLSVNPFIN